MRQLPLTDLTPKEVYQEANYYKIRARIIFWLSVCTICLVIGPLYNLAILFFSNDPAKTITPELEREYDTAKIKITQLDTKRQQILNLYNEIKPIGEMLDTTAYLMPRESQFTKLYFALDAGNVVISLEGYGKVNSDQLHDYISSLEKVTPYFREAKVMNMQQQGDYKTFRISLICQ